MCVCVCLQTTVSLNFHRCCFLSFVQFSSASRCRASALIIMPSAGKVWDGARRRQRRRRATTSAAPPVSSCQRLELAHSNASRRCCGGGSRGVCASVCFSVCAECDMFPLDTLCSSPPPLPPLPLSPPTAMATTAHGPSGEKQAATEALPAVPPPDAGAPVEPLEPQKKGKKKGKIAQTVSSFSLIAEYF